MQELIYMGFRIDLNDANASSGKIMFDDVDLSSGVMRVEVIAHPGEMTYAILKVAIEQLNGVDFGGAHV